LSTGKFNQTKEELKTQIRLAIPEGKVTGNWRVDIHDIVRNLPYISVCFSPEILWDVYDRNVGGEVAGSISDYHMSIHVFHSNCYSEPTCEKGKHAQDVGMRIMNRLLGVGAPLSLPPVGWDIDSLRMRESESSRGAHRISRCIIEGTIHIKRID